MTDTLDLDAIAARADTATPGPWTWLEGEIRGGYDTGIQRPWVADSDDDSDGEFIAHARTDVPALLAEVRRLRAANAALHQITVDAKDRLRSSSVPLGMSEGQFNAATILDTLRIITRPIPAPDK